MGQLDQREHQLLALQNYMLSMYHVHQDICRQCHAETYLARMQELANVLNFMSHATNGEFGKRYEEWDSTASRGDQERQEEQGEAG